MPLLLQKWTRRTTNSHNNNNLANERQQTTRASGCATQDMWCAHTWPLWQADMHISTRRYTYVYACERQRKWDVKLHEIKTLHTFRCINREIMKICADTYTVMCLCIKMCAVWMCTRWRLHIYIFNGKITMHFYFIVINIWSTWCIICNAYVHIYTKSLFISHCDWLHFYILHIRMYIHINSINLNIQEYDMEEHEDQVVKKTFLLKIIWNPKTKQIYFYYRWIHIKSENRLFVNCISGSSAKKPFLWKKLQFRRAEKIEINI